MTTITKTMLLLAALTLGCAHSTGSGGGDGGRGGDWTFGPTAGGGGTQGTTATGGNGGTTAIVGGSTTGTGSSLQALKDLCLSSGGTPHQDQCCSDGGEMPDSCAVKPSCGAVLTCSGGDSVDPSLWLCSCPGTACFDHVVGCTAQ